MAYHIAYLRLHAGRALHIDIDYLTIIFFAISSQFAEVNGNKYKLKPSPLIQANVEAIAVEKPHKEVIKVSRVGH